MLFKYNKIFVHLTCILNMNEWILNVYLSIWKVMYVFKFFNYIIFLI